eukprot:1849713-Rhodomonas_salina.1
MSRQRNTPTKAARKHRVICTMCLLASQLRSFGADFAAVAHTHKPIRIRPLLAASMHAQQSRVTFTAGATAPENTYTIITKARLQAKGVVFLTCENGDMLALGERGLTPAQVHLLLRRHFEWVKLTGNRSLQLSEISFADRKTGCCPLRPKRLPTVDEE